MNSVLVELNTPLYQKGSEHTVNVQMNIRIQRLVKNYHVMDHVEQIKLKQPCRKRRFHIKRCMTNMSINLQEGIIRTSYL